MGRSDLNSGPQVFMALETTGAEREKLQFLTTEVMHWSGDIWILDISPFARYWRMRAQSAGTTVIGLWRASLEQVFEQSGAPGENTVLSIAPPYRAACAENPWLAVLMLYGIQAGGVWGLVWQKSRTGRGILAGIDWECWWRGATVAGDHFLGVKRKGFKPSKFRKQVHRLKLAAMRLGFCRPGDMHILNEKGFKKRFGSELAMLWRWTFEKEGAGHPRDDSEQPAPFLFRMGFPWQGFRFRELPQVRRSPDFSLERWEQVAPQLREDLDKLCDYLQQSGERVVRLDWWVTLEDLKCLYVPICFRNPHDLRREAGDHCTALLQARYAFEDAAREAFPVSPVTGEVDAVLLICNWELVLSETLVIPNICFDIFGDIAGGEGELEILRRLENELPVSLNRFSGCRDWLPEDSYSSRSLAWAEAPEDPSEMQRSLDAVAEARPLYIRSNPLPLENEGPKGGGRFLENTLDKWWKKGGVVHTERSYFKHVDADGNATWIYRDSSGEWYEHGIFG